MQIITEKTVRQIVLENPAGMAVLESLGIDYCCGGGRLFSDACARAGVDPDEVQVLIEKAEGEFSAHDHHDWRELPLGDLIPHIVDEHHAFVRQETPRITALLVKVVARHGVAHPELSEIGGLFGAIAQELATHMMKEEQILFPYIKRMEESARHGGPRPAACFDSVKRPIANMIAEHDDAGALLERIRELAGGYRVPDGACLTYQALYRALAAFEHDLRQHVHLENNILFPRAAAIEEACSSC